MVKPVVLTLPANKQKVYYGLIKEPDINVPIEEDDDDQETERPKVRGFGEYNPSLYQ